MAPLPCSPVSNSTASESQSRSATEDSDDSLTTPRPGPSDPAQRTAANLSRPSVPPFSSSPDSPRSIGPAKASPLTGINKDSQLDTQTEGHPHNPYTYGSSPNKPNTQPGAEGISRPQPERQRSVSFSPVATAGRADRPSSYTSSYKMGARRNSPNVSPHAEMRNPISEETGESSADENTAIFPRDRLGGGVRNQGSNYGAIAGEDDEPSMQATGYDGGQEDPVGSAKRRRSKGSRNASVPGRGQGQAQTDEGESSEPEGWWKALVEKYGSIELENKGSVARDHLALERTFLAWLRTSLSFASIGIAVTQLFRLNTSLSNSGNTASSSVSASASSQQPVPFADTHRLRQVGKPLGATFLGISILILLLGFHRYFESQHYVIRGKFPASRGSIILVSLVACGLIVTSLIVVVTVAPSAFEKR